MWSLSNSSHSIEEILFKHLLLLTLGGPYTSVGYYQYFIDISPAQLNSCPAFQPSPVHDWVFRSKLCQQLGAVALSVF